MREEFEGTPEWNDELLTRRRKRAAVMGWVLAGFVVLFFPRHSCQARLKYRAATVIRTLSKVTHVKTVYP